MPGVYGGFIDKFPMGAFVNKGLTMKSGQTHVHRYLKPLLKRIQDGDIDPSFIITHRMTLDEAPQGYESACCSQRASFFLCSAEASASCSPYGAWMFSSLSVQPASPALRR